MGSNSMSLSEKLSQIPMPLSERTIYRVHSHLRNVNPMAYEPQVIAIGPYHRDKYNLKMMEDHKLHYLHLLLWRDNENVENYVSIIRRLESKARKCYAEPISLNETQFTEMLVLDGCFIIELVRKYSMRELREENDPIFCMDWIIHSLQRDLLLFENQIPFFVLHELFALIKKDPNPPEMMPLFLEFFYDLYPGKVPHNKGGTISSNKIKHLLDLVHCSWSPPPFDSSDLYPGKVPHNKGGTISSNKIKHLLDLVHCSWSPPPFDSSDLGEEESNDGHGLLVDSATGLTEANVKFEKNEEVNLFDIRFKDGIMRMAPLTIDDSTESCLRNLIAYEQYFQDTQTSFVTEYMNFLDGLIDSSKDVEILSHHGIIENWLGDGEVVAKMINKLGDSVIVPGEDFGYAKIFENVDKHCKRSRNKWMAKLRRNYLNSPWAITSILVAVVLLVLTVTQTVFTILQVV